MVNTSLPIPIVYNNNDYIDATEITNSITSKDSGGAIITEPQFERILCYNLTQTRLPSDVSNNLDQGQTITVTGGKEKLDGIMISNNEDLIESELMGLKLSYTTNTLNAVDETYTYAMTTGVQSKIIKKASTVSYQNSLLKIDISFNSDDQLSIDKNDLNADWKVQFKRNANSSNNYFAAANSHLNTYNDIYPMKLSEITKSDYIFNDGRFISDICGNTNEHNYSTFNNIYSLAYNNLSHDICNNYVYSSSDFTMYKLRQDDPTITLNLGTDAQFLPLVTEQNNNISDVTLLDFKNNANEVFSTEEIKNIRDGFKIDILIGENNNGGFTVSEADQIFLDVCNNQISNTPEFIAAGIKADNTSMYIDIVNGSLTLSGIDICSNITNVFIKSGNEFLEYPKNALDGSLNIYVDDRTNRVYDKTGPNNDSIAKEINVLYNCNEALAYNPAGCFILDNEMRINPEVDISAGIVVPTTTVDLNQCFIAEDKRNFAKSNNSVLVISNNDSPNRNSVTYENINFESKINNIIGFDDNDIVFISLKNNNILSEETSLIDNNNSRIPNSLANVSIQSVNLDDTQKYPYYDYRIKLENKKVTELATSAQPTNGWTIQSTNGSEYLVSNPIKTSILYDDCLFMRSGKDSSFNYTFNIATPVVTNIQSIKHRIDISFYDIDLSTDGEVSLSEKHAYLDDNDITYTAPTYYNTIEQQLSNSEYEFTTSSLHLLPEAINNQNKIKVYKVITDVSYVVSFEPKLPFYTNIKLESPVIHEEITNYKITDTSNNDLPDIYLKWLKDTTTNSKLSLVNVTQENTYSTLLKVNPSNCSTLKAYFMGVSGDLSNYDLVQINGSSTPDVDPFFNTETSIYLGDQTTTPSVNLNVQVTYPTIISQPYYIVDTTNKPGENISFEAKLYTYKTANSSFNNFRPYDDSWVSQTTNNWTEECPPPVGVPLFTNIVIDDSDPLGNTLILTIKDSENTLAIIKQPRTFINDFNIIRCLDPLVIRKYRIKNINDMWGDWNTSYTRATGISGSSSGDRNILIAAGIYLKTNGANPLQYSSVGFKLKPDRFSIEFVNGDTTINNGWDTIHNFTDIINNTGYSNVEKPADNKLDLTVNSFNDITRSIVFDKYRGYNRIGVNGIDNITIDRNSSTAIFTVKTQLNNANEQIYTQTFNDFAKDREYIVNNAVNTADNNSSFDTGLKFKGYLSLLNQDDNYTQRIYVTVTAASISWNFYNPQGELINYSADSTLLTPNFDELFNWKPRRISSDQYTISLTYNIPEFKYSKLNESGRGLKESPISKNNWGSEQTFNLSVLHSIMLSGVEIKRSQDYVPNGYISYIVVTPPQMKFEYNDITGVTIPHFPHDNGIKYDSTALYGSPERPLKKIYYITIDRCSSSEPFTYFLNNEYGITLKNSNLTNIQRFHTSSVENQNEYRFKIVGNYININYFAKDTYNAQTDTPTEYIFNNKTIDKLEEANSYTPRQLEVTKNGTQYQIAYKQFIQVNGTNRNSVFNIKLSISDAFLTPPPSGPGPQSTIGENSILIPLTAPFATVVSLYQANIQLIDSSFVLIIDKYETSGINYNYNWTSVDSSKMREVSFVIAKHFTSMFAVDGRDFPTGEYGYLPEGAIQGRPSGYGAAFDVNDLFSNININDICFNEVQNFKTTNSGIVLSALTNTGLDNLTNLFVHDNTSNLLSKTYYIYSQDMIRVNSLFGLPIYRLTNYGTVKTPGITTYSVNLANRTQLYDVSGSSILNPSNNSATPSSSNIQRLINTIPTAPV